MPSRCFIAVIGWGLDQGAYLGEDGDAVGSIHFVSENLDTPFVLGGQSQKHLHGGAFAGSIRAQEAVDGTLRYLKIDLVHGRATVVKLCEIFCLNNIFCHGDILLLCVAYSLWSTLFLTLIMRYHP